MLEGSGVDDEVEGEVGGSGDAAEEGEVGEKLGRGEEAAGDGTEDEVVDADLG